MNRVVGRIAVPALGIALLLAGLAGNAVAQLVKPQITSIGHADVTDTGAFLEMRYTTGGIPGSAYFIYSTNQNFDGAKRTRPDRRHESRARNIQGLVNLTPSTTYYYKGVVTNPNGTVESGVRSFQTLAARAPTPPELSRLGHDQVTARSANVKMVVTNVPVETWAYFVYSDKPDLSGARRTPDDVVGPYPTGVWTYGNLENLEPGKTYYYQGIARNKHGTVKSAIGSFNTY